MEDDDILMVIRQNILASYLEKVIDDGKLGSFIAFARERAIEDDMATPDLMRFFDKLEKEYMPESEKNKEWHKILEIISETTGCKVNGFTDDDCIIIENEKLSISEFNKYVDDDCSKAKINLERINKALLPINYKLEFMEALGLPFDADGFQNIVRFKVVKID